MNNQKPKRAIIMTKRENQNTLSTVFQISAIKFSLKYTSELLIVLLYNGLRRSHPLYTTYLLGTVSIEYSVIVMSLVSELATQSLRNLLAIVSHYLYLEVPIMRGMNACLIAYYCTDYQWMKLVAHRLQCPSSVGLDDTLVVCRAVRRNSTVIKQKHDKIGLLAMKM